MANSNYTSFVGESSVSGERKEKEMKKETGLGITAKKDEHFGNWYSQVCKLGELSGSSGIKGCYILKKSAMKIWKTLRRGYWFLYFNGFENLIGFRNMKTFFDDEIEKMGVEERYYPMFIPRDFLEKEKDHIEGFKPEVAWVTRAGDSDLPVPLALRPTSETVIYPDLSAEIRSHRDLPLKINQWANVFRWEIKDPSPFIRSREFLWQEGHTAFATKKEADEEVRHVLDLYSRLYEEFLAVPVIKGIKSENEKFAGALYTTSIEAFIPSAGRGIQAATSHCLGQNFAKMFDITFEDNKGKKSTVWQNSWGFSTRSIGVMVMTHGDDKGLVFPPKVALYQVVVIPVNADSQILCDACEAVGSTLREAGIRVDVDDRDNYSCGWKYSDQELKGAPLRIEIGPRDLAKNQVRIVRRDTGAKLDVKREDLIEKVKDLLENIQRNLYDVAKRKVEESTQKVETWDEYVEALSQKKLILAPWCDEVEVEKDVKERTRGDGTLGGAKTLCTPLEQPELREDTLCFASGKPAKKWTYWGRSY